MSIALHAYALNIPFRTSFRHASATRASTQTVWVQASRGGTTGHGEGCPREYVTAESLATADRFFASHADDWKRSIDGVESLLGWAGHNRGAIDANPAAWCALELALLDLFGREAERPVESLLGTPIVTGLYRYTAVIGDSGAGEFAANVERYRSAGFSQFKIKLSGDRERDLAKVRTLERCGVAPCATRADANNLWKDAQAAVAHFRALDFPFAAVEEPLDARDFDGLAAVASALETRIVLDESVHNRSDLDRLAVLPATWIVNLRVSKMGGLARSLALVPELTRRGLGLIVGAQVGETSILTRAALAVAAAGRDILLGQEGAFGTHLLASDVADPPLVFGAGGVLRVDDELAARAGLGLDVAVVTEALQDLRSAAKGDES